MLTLNVKAIFLTLAILCTSPPSIGSPLLDGGCTGMSHSKSSGTMLVTDEEGKVFQGTMENPLQTLMSLPGKVSQARFILDGSIVLVSYRSGAIETFSAGDLRTPLAHLPAYSYMFLSLSKSGHWAVGLSPGQTSADVLDLSAGQIRVVRHIEHPLGAAFRTASIADKATVLALLDERNKAHVLDWKTGRWLSVRDSGDLLDLKFVANDVLWSTVNGGVMQIGGPLKAGDLTDKLDGVPITRSARLVDTGSEDYLLAADDLGFTSLLKLQTQTGSPKYGEQGGTKLVTGLRESVSSPGTDRIAFCGNDLEVAELGTGTLVYRARGQSRPGVFVDNITDDGNLALVRDMDGRGAIWSLGQQNYVGMLPRLRLHVFPTFGALHATSKIYMSFGQKDVLTIARPDNTKERKALDTGYSVDALPIPFDGTNSREWENSIWLSPDSTRFAYLARGESISRIGLPSVGPLDFLSKFISASHNAKSCPAFGGRLTGSRNGELLAVGCVDGLAIYSTKTLKRLAFIAPPGWEASSARYKVWISSMAFAPDGESVVLAVRRQRIFLAPLVDQSLTMNEPSIYVYKWRRQELRAVKSAVGVPTTAVRFSNDGKQIWVGGYWGNLSAYSADDGTLLWKQNGLLGTIFGIAFDDKDRAVVWTEDGEIARISPNNHTLVDKHWIMNGGNVKVDGIQEATSTRGGDKLPIKLADQLPPEYFTNAGAGGAVVVSLKVSALFESPMQALLYVDDQVVGTGAISGTAKNGILKVIFPSKLFVPGHVSVGLFSQDGGASGALPLTVIESRNKGNTRGRLVGAFVGVSEYDSLPPLPLATTDAQALAAAFFAVEQSRISVSATKKQTKQDVLRFLKTAVDSAGYGDTLVLGLSGHGYSVGNDKFYFATSESGGPGIQAAHGIAPAELLELIASGRQGNTLLILDACESSGLIADVIRHPLLADGPLSLGNSGGGLAVNISVLAGAAKLRPAKEGYRGKGLLTGVVLDGLKGPADSNRDGSVSVTELLNYVDFAMARVSKKYFPTEAQDPVIHYGLVDAELVKVQR
ncbi:caspase family protein [Janthinobacterium agaricidamnosum]|nr:caspase family protein [Janthinobacterium agaricidamnosum]